MKRNATYATMITVELTVSDWLAMHCALSDAQWHNEENNYKETAREIVGLKARLSVQTREAMDQANESVVIIAVPS